MKSLDEMPMPTVLQHGGYSYWGQVLVLRMRRHGRIAYQLALAIIAANNLLCRLQCLIREISQEMGTALLRIRFRRTSTRYSRGVCFGPDLEESPKGWVWNSRTHSHMRDKLVFESIFPWTANPLDSLLFLEAWDMGAKYGENKQSMSGNGTLVDPHDYPYLLPYWKAHWAAEEIISGMKTEKKAEGN